MNRLRSSTAAAGSCWPNPVQLLLLRAALLDPPAAYNAWVAWRQAAHLEAIDPGSLRLLPLVYRNLTRAGVVDPLLGKLKGVHRKTWCRNQLALRDVAESLRALEGAGIQLMLLKGQALSHVYYRDLGVRPMDDVDLLVPVEDAPAAAAILQGLGWRAEPAWSEHCVATFNETTFTNASGAVIDLHWHLLPELCARNADDEFWAAARPTSVAGIHVVTLAPTDELFHACTHGVRWNRMSPLRWVADAHTILRSVPAEVSWERLVAVSQRHRLTLPIRAALRYLRSQLGVAVPPAVFAELDRVPVSVSERCELAMRVSPLLNTLLGGLPWYWLNTLRVGAAHGWPAARASFVHRLEMEWNCYGMRQIGTQALARGIRRVRALFHTA